VLTIDEIETSRGPQDVRDGDFESLRRISHIFRRFGYRSSRCRSAIRVT
jgi:hypothetical protein